MRDPLGDPFAGAATGTHTYTQSFHAPVSIHLVVSLFPNSLGAFFSLRRYWFGQDIRDISPVVLGPPETTSTPDGQTS